ncbi:unnamed protein product [Citrullus colocynthis]|uniref:Phytocyanin domain-containing protein n=1 Tax=Citrullus colocynthis TaxID=252529 RepID=A0ABP0YPJ6_9ROSI
MESLPLGPSTSCLLSPSPIGDIDNQICFPFFHSNLGLNSNLPLTMPPSPHLIAFFLLLCAAVALFPVSATDHIVGANRGWNPGINYTLWANNHTFYVGDFISFRYQKNQYNVFEVNQSGYDNCTTDGALGNWSGGKDFIPLNKAQRYYFICGNGQCFNGMKVTILVHPLPPPTSSPLATEHPSPSSATARAGSRQWRIRALLISLALIWFGSDWI